MQGAGRGICVLSGQTLLDRVVAASRVNFILAEAGLQLSLLKQEFACNFPERDKDTVDAVNELLKITLWQPRFLE